MKRLKFPVILACIAALACSREVSASPGSMLMKFLARNLSKEGGEEAAEKVGKEVGETAVERVATKVAKETGEESLEKVSALAAKHGPDVIRALDNAPSVRPIMKALDELPAEDVTKAAGRLAAGAEGKELAETTIRYGSTALRAEVAHPGIGGHFVKALGSDGAALCGKLTTEQAVSLGWHVDDIAVLPPSQRSDLLNLISTQTDRFVQFVGRFVEQNPGKVLLTASSTTVILANAERILGGDELKQDADGNWVVVSKPGLAGRAGEGAANVILRPIVRTFLWIAAPCLAIYAVIKLWGVWVGNARPARPLTRIGD